MSTPIVADAGEPGHRILVTLERPLALGDKIRFHDTGTADKRWWWEVQGVSDRFVIATHQAGFAPKGEYAYTIIDWRDNVRGPCTLLGNGWDFGPDLRDGAQRLLESLGGSVAVGRDISIKVEVSRRRSCPLGTIELHP
ncbi:hypothetical protein [Pseudolysinimonas sp.]|uniref:hypothetical protein n=1 Tax=Pseudolysinimonas sp. TaxID=2680009 RepID=UPI003F804DEE